MTVTEFIVKWWRVELTERSALQLHLLDLSDTLRHPKPAERPSQFGLHLLGVSR
jgi:hypothetical protein